MTFAKTDLGQDVLKNRTMPLLPKQRAMLIMADGTKDGAQLLALTAGMGTTVEDLTELVVKGLIASVSGAAVTLPQAPVQVASVQPVAAPVAAPVNPAPVIETPAAAVPKAADYKSAYQAGVALTSSLGFKGFRLNMSMESAADVDSIRELRPKIIEAMISKHGETKAKELMRDFDKALGLR